MDQAFPYVVAVASEKGGVGKTTIATNLAVYLKALREDLPVTIASFDNHFSVDQMFAIGAHRGESVAGLFAGTPAGELAQMGEYGVQFLASERGLAPPDDDLLHLCRALSRSNLPGILILDTRPILDYFTRSALLAADLVLVPVKDRPSLVNVAALHQALQAGGADPGRLWLVPSLVDARLRLRESLGVRDFLVWAARERGYQVVDTFLAKSPKVEGLATGLSSRIYPVLTHARSTAVHGQLRELAAFVLKRFDEDGAGSLAPAPAAAAARRLVPECPACGERVERVGHLFQDLRSRRRGLVHPACLEELLEAAGVNELRPAAGLLVLAAEGEGVAGEGAGLTLYLFDGAGAESAAEQAAAFAAAFVPLLQAATGRPAPELWREILLVTLEAGPPAAFFGPAGRAAFAARRRAALREVWARVR